MERIYISIAFKSTRKTYFFYTVDPSIKVGDSVIVETVVGKEIGVVIATNIKVDENFANEIKPIITRATDTDLRIEKENEELALKANDIFTKTVEELKFDMRLISSEYTFDRSKILFVYASDERIDFRELLKILAGALHCRIELRQINSRERAQAVGGIGICGLEICCTTFFKTFDGISLNRAKNQMLAINIPKLSGQCGKLMCCLKYEDDLYTEAKKEFPRIGIRVRYNNLNYKLSGYNVLTKVCKIENPDDVEFVSLDELNKMPKIEENYSRENN
jgi:cell fate regulator YaaT (PSP1 superfamily)